MGFIYIYIEAFDSLAGGERVESEAQGVFSAFFFFGAMIHFSGL